MPADHASAGWFHYRLINLLPSFSKIKAPEDASDACKPVPRNYSLRPA